jgi:hypothetical protein
VADSCGHCSESSFYVNGSEFLDQQNDYRCKDTVARRQIKKIVNISL